MTRAILTIGYLVAVFTGRLLVYASFPPRWVSMALVGAGSECLELAACAAGKLADLDE